MGLECPNTWLDYYFNLNSRQIARIFLNVKLEVNYGRRIIIFRSELDHHNSVRNFKRCEKKSETIQEANTFCPILCFKMSLTCAKKERWQRRN